MAVPVAPQARPQPTAAACLPHTLSASQLEALRQPCPYRFFARAVLRLDEAEELEAGLDKRDYGTWLHAVLHHFHAARQPGDAAAALQEAATAVTRASDLDEADLLPIAPVSRSSPLPTWIGWLRAKRKAGSGPMAKVIT